MPPGTPGDAARLRGNPLWAVPMRELSATRDRPIFSPSRRPASPPAVVQAPPQLPPPPPLKPKEPDHPRLTILGTVLGGSDSIGIFMEEATSNVLRVHAGQVYAGWVLRALTRREAIFEKAEALVTLHLPAPREEATAPVAATPPGATPGTYAAPAAVAQRAPTALVERRRRD